MNITSVVKRIQKIVGEDGILTDKASLIAYESDGMPHDRYMPCAVIIPETAQETSRVVKILHDAQIPFVPRGAGTGLSGGCLPIQGGVVLSLTRMSKILEINPEDRYAIVEPGVINQTISDRVKQFNLHYAPDPSSGHASTVGGNIAENAGGPHTMKYGVTVNHILGLEMVLPNGDIIEVGGVTPEIQGYDIPGVINGSEGTFAIVTKVTVKLTPLPEGYATFYAVYETVDDATRSITGLLKAGLTPAALELIDGEFVSALKRVFNLKFPENAGAVLVIELDGMNAELSVLTDRVKEICKEYNVTEITAASNAEERAQLWKARKLAFGAVGRMSPNYINQDGCLPRTKLPDILNKINEVAKTRDVRIANAFHAGDGNIHPCVMYDESILGDKEKAHSACEEILEACVGMGGTISGEHGIGCEKHNFMRWIFNDRDLRMMADVKHVFNPDNLLNPGKIFPDDFSEYDNEIKAI